MYYSLDGSNWSLFWSQSNLQGWTTYSDTAHILDAFRYIRANTDGCSVDWCEATVDTRPTVKIIGPHKVVVANKEAKFASTPPVTLDATGDPPGGSYKWEIISGGDKAKLRGNVKSSHIAVIAEKPSESPGDVVIQVTYTYESVEYHATHWLTIQWPTRLVEVIHYTTPTTYAGVLAHYVTTYEFRSLDQFDDRLYGPYSTDEWVYTLSANPGWYFAQCLKKNWQKPTHLSSSCSMGDICDTTDTLEPPRAGLLPIPSDFSYVRVQYIYFQGWLVDTRRQEYYCTYATSTSIGP